MILKVKFTTKRTLYKPCKAFPSLFSYEEIEDNLLEYCEVIVPAGSEYYFLGKHHNRDAYYFTMGPSLASKNTFNIGDADIAVEKKKFGEVFTEKSLFSAYLYGLEDYL